MKYENLLHLAKPYLEQNDLGLDHTLRVLSIAIKNFDKYKIEPTWKDTAYSLIVLHDIGGSEIKEQYEQGPKLARKLLTKLEYTLFDINLICGFIAKHHERLENPHEVFKLLFDADRLVMFSKQEFADYNSKPGFDWNKIVEGFYNNDLKEQAKRLLKQRKEEVEK
ncbi:HD domain-containing protein [Nanoarchaeota archaeon]